MFPSLSITIYYNTLFQYYGFYCSLHGNSLQNNLTIVTKSCLRVYNTAQLLVIATNASQKQQW